SGHADDGSAALRGLLPRALQPHQRAGRVQALRLRALPARLRPTPRTRRTRPTPKLRHPLLLSLLRPSRRPTALPTENKDNRDVEGSKRVNHRRGSSKKEMTLIPYTGHRRLRPRSWASTSKTTRATGPVGVYPRERRAQLTEPTERPRR